MIRQSAVLEVLADGRTRTREYRQRVAMVGEWPRGFGIVLEVRIVEDGEQVVRERLELWRR